MSANLTFALLAAAQIVVPLGRVQPVERLPAPIATSGPAFAARCKDDDDWNRSAPPVRLHGNTYYVGTCGIAAILITGKDGHILIDSGTEKGGELVGANIRRLGFKLADVRYLLHSHEHYDHVGGMALLRQLTGAELIASAPAAEVFRTGRPSAGDPQGTSLPPFPAVPVARTVKGGDRVRLGDIQLTAVATPGHTPGALSWQWVSCDGGVCRTFVYADSLSPVSAPAYRFRDHPALVASFRSSIARIAALECDVLVTPHPSASGLRSRVAKGTVLLDPKGCVDYAVAKTRALDERFAKEDAAK